MLFLVAAWLLLLAIAIPFGLRILQWTGGERAFDRPGDRLVLAAWLGVVVLGSGLLALSFVFPLTPALGLAAGAAALAVALASARVREELHALRPLLTSRRLAATLALLCGVAIATAQPVVWIDTGIYHASAIRWLSEFGAVEGIGLVHHRLGFASAWFALAAPFNPDGLRSHAAAVMGGFGLLLVVLHAALCAGRALDRRARPADWMIIAGSALLIPASLLSSKVHVSPSPDLPVNALTLLSGWAILSLALAGRAGGVAAAAQRLSAGPLAIPLLLALGAMAIKPHAGPVVAIAALFYLFGFGARGWLHRAAWALGLGTVLLGPWLAYEFLTTGCPAFPVGICADVGWSVGTQVAEEATESVANARWETFFPGEGLSWVEPWLTNDLSTWLSSLAIGSVLLAGAGAIAGRVAERDSPLRGISAWLVLAGAAGLFAFLVRAEELAMVAIALVSLASVGNRAPGSRWLIALGVGGIALLVYAAPDPRFGFGYTGILIGRFGAYPPRSIWPRVRAYLTPAIRAPRLGLATLLALAAVLAAIAPIARPTTSRGDVIESFGLIVPPELRAAAITTTETNGIEYRVPADGFCWSAELPCTPDPIDSAIVLRDPGEGIEGGFERR